MSWDEIETTYRHLLSPRFRGWEICPGWRGVVEDLLRELDRQTPHAKVTQIKEKFGSLRVYTEDKTREDVKQILRRAEARSAMTCEICGEAALPTSTDRPVHARCGKHQGT